jgi:predicted 3-demethylubiquinone-9 3-methyltransferase (glyoxalase superfamily)
MQKIVPHLWYDTEAREAAEFYCSLFADSKVTNVTTIHDVPSPTGDSDIVSFRISGQPFMAISAGPLFKFNPSISFFVILEDQKEVDKLWNKLKEGGSVLMNLQKYDWSEKYGWVQDKFGLSWQISVGNKKDVGGNTVSSSLLFVGDKYGKAKEAVNFYTSVFNESEIAGIMESPDGSVLHAQFYLHGGTFMAMDSKENHKFDFNEAISFMINCDTQKEIDYYWEKFTSDGGAESMCGWCRDKYGVWWQITPTILGEMMSNGTKSQVNRITQAFLPMKKFNIAELEKAYNGN